MSSQAFHGVSRGRGRPGAALGFWAEGSEAVVRVLWAMGGEGVNLMSNSQTEAWILTEKRRRRRGERRRRLGDERRKGDDRRDRREGEDSMAAIRVRETS